MLASHNCPLSDNPHYHNNQHCCLSFTVNDISNELTLLF
ncbi:hypothetical protein YPPY66_1543 [Yersinia pestis PY-66]|uniref:Uncharacterized protein n=1 Tax=Yersinia pestis PY-08 TaxID=992134 RepID=A0AB72ZQ40_YERPE|nr:hypothetical protein YpAngola_A1417 [Yersinia pestis Angola]ADV97853.1 hypothetical protein YPC_1199 [Yersinia pestis biovar Medievalis str. Harbin 35]EDR61666.1 hypothetical protein YpUG050454_1935 [Yersinia pestis biovar Antiqua str. UG05-0454]EEO75329.1 hypothetical protein YP516_3231 [Yersinia pestis Nepal516]EEO81594.1 hypothetical protein YPF_1556 [Yersinia pestis biovar Orientalis str. India 195]EEO87495.1 hypothetical protein YPH_3451 [Yersinia pestis biovar Orientalis str. PEXU2]E